MMIHWSWGDRRWTKRDRRCWRTIDSMRVKPAPILKLDLLRIMRLHLRIQRRNRNLSQTLRSTDNSILCFITMQWRGKWRRPSNNSKSSHGAEALKMRPRQGPLTSTSLELIPSAQKFMTSRLFYASIRLKCAVTAINHFESNSSLIRTSSSNTQPLLSSSMSK